MARNAEHTMEVRPQHAFDVAALERYMAHHVDGFSGTLQLRQYSGGQSNPTFLLESKSGAYVLRKKPPGELLPSAHAVDREYRVITALGSTDVPVPRTYCLCEDETVIGHMFYIMERVEGRVFGDPAAPGVEPGERADIYRSLAESLARLHRVDYQAVGLEGYGRPGNYFQRQINRWLKQFEASKTVDIPAMDNLGAWLTERIPTGDESTIAHGDYRLENTIVHATEPRVVAILDWELSTIGHPLADVGLSLLPLYLPPGTPTGFREAVDPQALGMPTPREYVAEYCRYAEREPIEDFDYYVIFSMFRLASILQGIAMRARTGTAAADNAHTYGDAAGAVADKAWVMAQGQPG